MTARLAIKRAAQAIALAAAFPWTASCGSGAVTVKEIPAGVVAVGNPARVVRTVEQA